MPVDRAQIHQNCAASPPGNFGRCTFIPHRPATSVSGGYDIQDETVFHASYREWLRLMAQGTAKPASGTGSAK